MGVTLEASSYLRQTHARMRCMTYRLQRAVSRLLASSPTMSRSRHSSRPRWLPGCFFRQPSGKSAHKSAVAVTMFVSILVYACVDRGQLFAYFGWVHPRRRIFWLYALIAGAAAAALVIRYSMRSTHRSATPTGNTALRSHHRTHHRRDPVPRCGVFRHLCDRGIDQGALSACGSR